jgi:hypothetical protein
MSSLSTASALSEETQTWPVLTNIEIDRAAVRERCGKQSLARFLYRPEEVGRPCFILL